MVSLCPSCSSAFRGEPEPCPDCGTMLEPIPRCPSWVILPLLAVTIFLFLFTR